LLQFTYVDRKRLPAERLVAFAREPSSTMPSLWRGISPSTAVCSILFGDDPAGGTPYLNSFLYQGAVPAAEGHVYELYYFLAQHVYPQNAPKVDVATASFGQELEDWWTCGIEAMIEHQGLVLWPHRQD
jgi:hypothetical protein